MGFDNVENLQQHVFLHPVELGPHRRCKAIDEKVHRRRRAAIKEHHQRLVLIDILVPLQHLPDVSDDLLHATDIGIADTNMLVNAPMGHA